MCDVRFLTLTSNTASENKNSQDDIQRIYLPN